MKRILGQWLGGALDRSAGGDLQAALRDFDLELLEDDRGLLNRLAIPASRSGELRQLLQPGAKTNEKPNGVGRTLLVWGIGSAAEFAAMDHSPVEIEAFECTAVVSAKALKKAAKASMPTSVIGI